MRLVLYQPEIPQNTGTLLRLGACLDIPVALIQPYGFVWSDQKLRRSGMDYLDQVTLTHYKSWQAFCEEKQGRHILLTRHADTPYTDFEFAPADQLIFGSESAGVPEAVHKAVDARLTIPLRPDCRSLNVAIAAAMVAGEMRRQHPIV